MKRSHSLRLAVAGTCLLFIAACGTTTNAPLSVVARVNGVDITAAELDEVYLSNILGVDPAPDEEEADDLKLQLLTEIVTNTIMMQMAQERGLTATDAEVDVRFNEYKSQYSAERFQEMHDAQQLTTDGMRDELRTGLTIEKLVNMEITSKISVSDADIEEFFARNMASFNFPEAFLISHILITPVADADINNLEGDDATTVDEARDKATRLLRQIQGGQDFGTMARRYSEDPSSVATNGEIGFQPLDAIAGVDPALAQTVLNMRVGETYPNPVETRFGFHLLKLIDMDPGGQKDLSDPRVESDIRQIIFNRRDQLLRGAFYETARDEAAVQNFFAQRILDRTY